MFDFRDLPLRNEDKAKQIAKDVEAICLKVAQDNRAVANGDYVVQHSHAELIALYEIVARVHDQAHLAGNVLQCGLFCGGSALMMAHAMRDDESWEAPLIAIDSYTKDYAPLRYLFDNAYVEYRENVREFRLQEHISAVISDTVSYLNHFWKLPLRVAFIDSSHHYEPTKKELTLILPHMVDGGWLIMHDYFSDATPGVQRAAHESFQEQDTSDWMFYRAHELAIIQLRSGETAQTQGTSEQPRPLRHMPQQFRC